MIYLQHILKRSIALLLALVALSYSLAFASPETMPVDQITPGMRGIAKTVVSGTKIEEFGVEVLGIMKGKGPSGDLILVRTYGDLIDRTGGIAQGMSGSPVYIDGKLVGAIAYGWSLTDHKIGMVTPIADMLKLWDMPDVKNKFAAFEITLTTDGTFKKVEPIQNFGSDKDDLILEIIKKSKIYVTPNSQIVDGEKFTLFMFYYPKEKHNLSFISQNFL